jgi:hypothetical protein
MNLLPSELQLQLGGELAAAPLEAADLTLLATGLTTSSPRLLAPLRAVQA